MSEGPRDPAITFLVAWRLRVVACSVSGRSGSDVFLPSSHTRLSPTTAEGWIPTVRAELDSEQERPIIDEVPSLFFSQVVRWPHSQRLAVTSTCIASHQANRFSSPTSPKTSDPARPAHTRPDDSLSDQCWWIYARWRHFHRFQRCN